MVVNRMKRVRTAQPPLKINKFQKREHLTEFLERLPHELTLHILRQLTRADLIALSEVSRALRRVFLPYLFAHTKISWKDLVANWADSRTPVPIDATHLIESVRMTDCCSKNEWTFPLADLFSAPRLPNLKSLELPTSGSTSFLKYSVSGSHLQVLKLSAVKAGSVFSLEHVKPFNSLKQLTLQDYEIETFDEEPKWCPSLSTLELRDCSWCYPFQLENFGHEKIKKLILNYSSAFIISERFKMFLNNPNFDSLSQLEITNSASNLKLTLSVQIMRLIESIPTLKTLKLEGNVYNETLQNFTSSDLDNCLTFVALNNVKVFYSTFIPS